MVSHERSRTRCGQEQNRQSRLEELSCVDFLREDIWRQRRWRCRRRPTRWRPRRWSARRRRHNRPAPTAAPVPTVAPPSDKKTALFPLASPAGPDSGQAAPKTGASGSDIIEDDDTSMDTADPDFSQDFELDDAVEVTKSAPVISNEGIKSF